MKHTQWYLIIYLNWNFYYYVMKRNKNSIFQNPKTKRKKSKKKWTYISVWLYEANETNSNEKEDWRDTQSLDFRQFWKYK